MSRTLARESTYKLIFEYLFSGKPNKKTFEVFSDAEPVDDDKKYIYNVYKGVISHYDELVALIAQYAEGFSVERIFRPDLAALLLSTYEMLYMKDIPQSVSISEAVELVKRYSTEKSNQYVNGILSAIYKKLNDK